MSKKKDEDPREDLVSKAAKYIRKARECLDAAAQSPIASEADFDAACSRFKDEFDEFRLSKDVIDMSED